MNSKDNKASRGRQTNQNNSSKQVRDSAVDKKKKFEESMEPEIVEDHLDYNMFQTFSSAIDPQYISYRIVSKEKGDFICAEYLEPNMKRPLTIATLWRGNEYDTISLMSKIPCCFDFVYHYNYTK